MLTDHPKPTLPGRLPGRLPTTLPGRLIEPLPGALNFPHLKPYAWLSGAELTSEAFRDALLQAHGEVEYLGVLVGNVQYMGYGLYWLLEVHADKQSLEYI